MFPLERIADEPTKRSCTVKYLLKFWPLAVKAPGQSLDYRANSYNIHLNALEFHGYGKEISHNCPCSLYPINTSFLGILPPPCHSTSSKPIFPAAASLENPKSPARTSPNSSSNLRSSSFPGRNGCQLHRPWGQFFSPLLFLLPYFYLLQIYLLSTFFSSFSLFCSSNLQTFRNWLRKSWFLPSNLTFNVLGRWVTQILPIWSMRKQIGSPLELRISP